ncbi:MAG: hypothetical protein K6F02_08295, partial [Prevotella sp.]|nr:hypothetical protein [Prevotella sp.]
MTKVMGKDMKSRPALKTMQMQNNVSLQQSARTGFLTTKKLNEKNAVRAPWNKTRRAADELITEEPAGNKVLYSRSGDANYYFYGYIFSATVQDAVGNVVFGDDNTVYFKNLITQYPTNSWTKGTINGSTITIEFPQKALDIEGQYYYLNYGTIDEELTFTPKGSLTLNYNAETGDITPASEDFINGDAQIALVDADNYWAGYSDWNLNLKKNTDELVTAPKDLKTEIYSLIADGFSGALVNVGFSGNDVYVQGIDANLPENWIKGTISGDKVVFKAGQYIGADEVVGYHQYLMPAKGEQVYDDYYEEYYTEYVLTDGDIEFKYDAATKSLSESSTFLVNAGKTTVNYLSVFEGASIAPFKEVAATPATPVITELYEGGPSYFLNGYGWGYISADIPTSDVDGKFILGDKLSYALWVRVNGEEKQITLSDWDYQRQVVETMTEVPFGYSDDWDVYASGINQTLYYYVIGPEAYGIQAIYRGAGEERRSEIAWAATTSIGAEIQPDPATPAYPAVDPSDTGSSINFGYYTGDEEIGATSNNFKPETYDVAIKIQDEALVGTHIESITFPLQEVQGVSNISAWIS